MREALPAGLATGPRPAGVGTDLADALVGHADSAQPGRKPTQDPPSEAPDHVSLESSRFENCRSESGRAPNLFGSCELRKGKPEQIRDLAWAPHCRLPPVGVPDPNEDRDPERGRPRFLISEVAEAATQIGWCQADLLFQLT